MYWNILTEFEPKCLNGDIAYNTAIMLLHVEKSKKLQVQSRQCGCYPTGENSL